MRKNIVGFETGDFSEVAAHTGSAIIPVTDRPSGKYALDLTRTGAVANAELRGLGADGKPAYYNLPTAYYRFYLRPKTLPSSSDSAVINFQDATSAYKVAIHITSTGQLAFYDNTPVLLQTGSTKLPTGQWSCIEAQIGTGSSASWAIRINTNPEISGSGNLGATNNGSIKFGGNAVYSDSLQIDDVSIDDASFPGLGQITALNAYAAGSDNGWTAGISPSDWTDTSETVPDGDLTYVATTTSGDAFTVKIVPTGNLNISGQVAAIKSCCVARDAGSTAMHQRVRSGSALAQTTDTDPGTSYVLLAQVLATDPFTNAPWTLAGVDVVEVGMVNSTTSAARLTYASVMVDYNPMPPPAGHPIVTGNVTMTLDGVVFGSPQTLINGQTFFIAIKPAIGMHPIVGNYGAQGQFAATSANASLVVSGTGNQTTTSISAPNVIYPANVAVTVTVTSAAGTPTGTVSLSVDGGMLTSQTLTNGSTTFSIPGLTVATHTLSAIYPAQAGFLSSTATGSVTVFGTATSIAIGAPTVTFPADAVITVTVTASTGTPTGIINLTVDTTAQPSQTLVNGVATFTVPGLSVGVHNLSANYPAQANFAASSATGTIIIAGTPTTTAITAPSVTFPANAQVTVTVTATAGTPSGNVTLSVDGKPATSLPLTNGSAVFTITTPSVGTHTLQANYAAQGSFQSSNATGTLLVNGTPTSTTITAPTVTWPANGTVTVTVTTTAATPTGTVSLTMDGLAVGTAQTLQNGSTTFTIPNPSVGTHSLVATYPGQGQFAPSSATGTLVVQGAATHITISAPTVTYPANLIVTVTVSSP